MAKGTNRISIRTIDAIAKEQFPNFVTEIWNGTELRIKKSLSFSEMLSFVNDVVKSCIQEEHGYMPELMDFAIKSNILSRYANFSLPDNLEHRYDILYQTDAVAFVVSHINKSQLQEITTAINHKISYLCNSNIQQVQKQMGDFLTAFETLQGKMTNLFSNLTPDDVTRLIGAINDGGLDESKIVSAYLKQTKNRQTPEH